MPESKVYVEFTTNDRDAFHKWLQVVTDDSSYWQPAPGNKIERAPVVGYRADDFVQRREALAKFVDGMEAKLRKNDHKSNWREKPLPALLKLMLLEVEEFKVALEFFTISEARPELIDIANFAMILWDRLGMLDQDKSAEVKL